MKASTTPPADFDCMQLLHFDLDRIRRCQLHVLRAPRSLPKAEAVAQPVVFAFKALGAELAGADLARVARYWMAGR